jgi:hypothetical protein
MGAHLHRHRLQSKHGTWGGPGEGAGAPGGEGLQLPFSPFPEEGEATGLPRLTVCIGHCGDFC